MTCRSKLGLTLALVWVAVGAGVMAAQSRSSTRPQQDAVVKKAIPRHALVVGRLSPEEWLVRDLYARLMRYDYAARQAATHEDGAVPQPDAFLVVKVAQIRTAHGDSGGGDSAVAGGVVGLERQQRCHRKDPCHASYRVAWGAGDETAATEDLEPPSGRVTRVTTYRVILTLSGETREYAAQVRYHVGEKGAAPVPEVVDPVIPGLQQLLNDRAPLAVAAWDTHVRTRRYAAVVQRVRGQGRAGQRIVPGRTPIGFLPGDDVTTQDEQQVRLMSSGVPCGSALVPTYVAIIGTPAYTQGPPAPYVFNVNRQVLDQNGDPLNRTMFVDETYTPNPPSGNCTILPVDTGDADTNDYGMFGPDFYTLSREGPSGCSSTATQSFIVVLDGRSYNIITRYQVTWTNDYVTVQCIVGC
jgi:hypothetical protein